MSPRALLLLVLPVVLAAQTLTLEPLTVSTSRTPEPLAHVPFPVATVDATTLRDSPASTIDGALRSMPSFSLFRRTDSLTANPTAQGVSLRGLGPSGASRSLVLLDGIPLNDPFGGWVAWSKIPREALASIEVVRGGGATAWGNAALGGVVQLLTAPPEGATNRVSLSGGDFGTHSEELTLAQQAGPGAWQLMIRDFGTGGVPLVAQADRGPIDVPAWSRHLTATARCQQPVGPRAELTLTARRADEQRGNGTPYQGNRSREGFVSAQLDGRTSAEFTWTAAAYAQDQTFSSTFSSVNATRTAETPASDQFAVPAAAGGGAFTGRWGDPDRGRTSAGVDFRTVRGETRENFTFSNGNFTRTRVAGGAQDFAGIFALHERQLAPAWRATLGTRLDYWQERRGHRRELDRATGAVLRDDHYGTHEGLPFSPSAGLIWQPNDTWRARLATQESFRRPTLNELYRPFRVGNVITEANPALRTERATSVNLGSDYLGKNFKLTADLFWNELRDAVGNVTLARGPGTFPIVGFVPAGGLGRQRQNLDRLVVRGGELGAQWRPTSTLSLDAAYLYNDGEVTASRQVPALVGKRLAQVPRHSASLGVTWRTPAQLTVTSRLRWVSAQFEDDENLLPLAAATTVDLALNYSYSARGEVFLAVENVGSARVETGRVADGIVSVAPPRLARGGVRLTW